MIIENLPKGEDLIIAAGYTSSSVQNNVGHCGGFGLEHYFSGRCKAGKYKALDALLIDTPQGRKTVVYAGGSTKSANNKIHGFSASLLIIDEIDRIHENMIEELKQRIQARPNAKVVVSQNPNMPRHKIYDLLNNLLVDDEVLYEHYTLWDNPGLNAEEVAKVTKGMDPSSDYYRKYVLGERINPEGALFTVNDYNILNELDYNKYHRYSVVLDLGESKSATAFVLASPYFNDEAQQWELHVLKEYHHLNDSVSDIQKKSPLNYIEDYVSFIKESQDIYNKVPERVLFDATNQFWRDLTKGFNSNNLGNLSPKRVTKDDEDERIYRMQSWLYQGKLRIYRGCVKTIEDLRNAEYDSNQFEKKGKIMRKEDYTYLGHGDMIDCIDYLGTQYKGTMK